VSLLILPEALGRCVAHRDDPFDAKAGRAEERLDKFVRQVIGPGIESMIASTPRMVPANGYKSPTRLLSQSCFSII
jgi:hypothetical protein